MKLKITVCLMALLMVLTVFCGCSAKDQSNNTADKPEDSYGGSAGMDGKPSEEVKPDGTQGEFERKIIRTVNMTCESLTFDDAVTVIMTTLEANGGYVEASSLSGTGVKAKSVAQSTASTGQARRATYTLRIPAEKLDAFLGALRVDGNIRTLSQSISSDEVTGAYYDIQTRLETLTAEKNALNAMLESFTDYENISGMLEVQERLYNVIEEMEALQTKLNLYDSQVAYSTVYLTLAEVVEYTEEEEPTFGSRISNAFSESWTAFGENCQDFAVWFVGALPTLLVLLVIGGVVSVIVVLATKKKRN